MVNTKQLSSCQWYIIFFNYSTIDNFVPVFGLQYTLENVNMLKGKHPKKGDANPNEKWTFIVSQLEKESEATFKVIFNFGFL
jgi:hypothetical protein